MLTFYTMLISEEKELIDLREEKELRQIGFFHKTCRTKSERTYKLYFSFQK
jgi:hypothetical protein